MQQHFYGRVGQVAGHDIHNVYLTMAKDPEMRRQELIERQRQHVVLRAAAAREKFFNKWNAAMGVLLLATAAFAWSSIESLPSILSMKQPMPSWEWPTMIALALAVTAVAYGLDAFRKTCEARWQMHNDAIRVINQLLAQL